jgi:GTP cyclohydrolase I
VSDVTETQAQDAVLDLLSFIGEDVMRDGLHETPRRFVKALGELTAGYRVDDPPALLKTFENDGTRDMVLVRDIPFYSLCEHHVLPFYGVAHVAYVPGDRIVGLSKFGRLVEAFARRLQVQERLTAQIADTLEDTLSPAGVIVVVEAQHLCMAMRGVQKPGALTLTSAVRGVFRTKPEARAEALSLMKGQ